jgi:hypothetical protein
MNRSVSHFFTASWAVITLGTSPAAAQSFESVGHRALGMGGAFVAVANDSSATWWNPAGLAAGPFLDVAIGRSLSATDGSLPASRTGAWSVSVTTPPLGLSYYRLKITDIRAMAPTDAADGGREDGGAGKGVRSLSISQFGATVLHTITTGLSAGATVKYVRGTARLRGFDPADAGRGIPDLLDAGDDLEAGEGEGTVDVDVGLLAIRGPVRLGFTARNLREPHFGDRRVDRQLRAGAAFDGAARGAIPVMFSVDADLRSYESTTGERRVIAFGGEQWVRPARIAVRGGARFNTVGEQDRAVTAGASVAPRAGLFVDGYAAVGSDSASGWGVAARVAF